MVTLWAKLSSKSGTNDSSASEYFSPSASTAQACQSKLLLIASNAKLQTAQQSRINPLLKKLKRTQRLQDLHTHNTKLCSSSTSLKRTSQNSKIHGTGLTSSLRRASKICKRLVSTQIGDAPFSQLKKIPITILLLDGSSDNWKILTKSRLLNDSQSFLNLTCSLALIMIAQRERV